MPGGINRFRLLNFLNNEFFNFKIKLKIEEFKSEYLKF